MRFLQHSLEQFTWKFFEMGGWEFLGTLYRLVGGGCTFITAACTRFRALHNFLRGSWSDVDPPTPGKHDRGTAAWGGSESDEFERGIALGSEESWH